MSGPTTAEKAIEFVHHVWAEANRIQHLADAASQALPGRPPTLDNAEARKTHMAAIDRAMTFATMARELAKALGERAELAEVEINIIAHTGSSVSARAYLPRQSQHVRSTCQCHDIGIGKRAR